MGPGSRVFDSDQHDFDAEHPEVAAPVAIGDYVWIASDVTVLRGVTIGEHSVIGARSLVTRDVPAALARLRLAGAGARQRRRSLAGALRYSARMPLRIALFGQAAFGKDVLVRLLEAGHEVVGVYVPPDEGRPDPLAAEAAARGLRLLRHKRFRRAGAALPELVAEHRALGAELNVLAFVTTILPHRDRGRAAASARSASILRCCRASAAARRSRGRSSWASASRA